MDLFDALPDPALLIRQRRVERANAAAQAFFGPSLDGLCVDDVLPLGALAALEEQRPGPQTCRHLDGSNRLLSWSCTHLSEAQGGGCLLLASDLTGRVPEGVEGRLAQLEALNRLSMAVAAQHPLDQVCEQAFRALGGLAGVSRGGVAGLEGSNLVGHYSWKNGLGSPDSRRWDRAATPGSACLDRKAPVQLRTSGAQAVRWRQLAGLARAGVKVVLYLPLDPVHPVGVLSLGSTRMSGFSPEAIAAAQRVAEPLALAVRRLAP